MPVLPIFGITASMGKNTSISLSERHQKYLQSKVDSGEYASVSEVVRDAVREHMDKAEKSASLRAIIQKSLESGEPREFDIDGWFEEKFGVE